MSARRDTTRAMKKKSKKKRARRVVEIERVHQARATVRSIVGSDRLERSIYESVVATTATRVQAMWQEQHPGEVPDPTTKSLALALEARHIGELSMDVTMQLLRVFDTMAVKL